MFAPGKPFQPSLLFVGKARSLPLSGAPERCFTWVGSWLICKHYTILERLSRDEHSILLQKFVTYGYKKFYNIGPWAQCYKTFYGLNLQMMMHWPTDNLLMKWRISKNAFLWNKMVLKWLVKWLRFKWEVTKMTDKW